MATERAARTQRVEAVGTIDMSQIKAGAIDWRTYCGSLIYLGGPLQLRHEYRADPLCR